METRAIRHSHRCYAGSVESTAGLCIPPVLSDRENTEQVQERAGRNPPSSTNLAPVTLVPCSSGTADRGPNPAAIPEQSTEGSIRSTPPPRPSPLTSACRLEGVRGRLQSTGISQQASELITAGWSKGTNSAYQSAWSRWQRWCLQRQIDPFVGSVSAIVNFLSSLFEEGLQHRTINTIRSAISATHDPIDGIPAGQHPVVTRLMKGVYNLRPLSQNTHRHGEWGMSQGTYGTWAKILSSL